MHFVLCRSVRRIVHHGGINVRVFRRPNPRVPAHTREDVDLISQLAAMTLQVTITHLEPSPKQVLFMGQTAPSTQIFLSAHLPLAMGITAFGVSTKRLVLLELGDLVPVPYLWLATLSVGTTMLAVAVVAAVTRTDGGPTPTANRVWPRVVSATALVGIAGFGTDLRAELSLSFIAAVCVAQIVFESHRTRGSSSISR